MYALTLMKSENTFYSLQSNFTIEIKYFQWLFIFHFQSFCLPRLITETYYLLFPPAHGRQRYRPPLLRHHKVKDWTRGDVLCHTGMAVGDILPNWLQPRFHYLLPNRGYSQQLFWHQGILPVIRYATQLWRLPSNLIMLGVTTHKYDPKSRTYWTTVT